MKEKIKIGVFKFTGCSGCQMELLRLEEEFLTLLQFLDVEYWAMVSSKEFKDKLDVSFVEGSISTPWEVEEIKNIRERSKLLVALGDCAVTGCLPSIRNWIDQNEAEKAVYEHPEWIESVRLLSISEHVPVDILLPGCPPHRRTFLEVVKAALMEVNPQLRGHSVCVECKLNDNACLLTAEGLPCMGPVTKAGCGAICPSLNRICENCYGAMSDSNARSLAQIFEEEGLSKDDIIRKFRKYAGMTSELKEEAE